MTSQSAERLTTINRQEKAALIWAIADKLVGVYKPHEYGNVILPMCVIKRFEDTLAPTREAVWKKNEELGSMDDVLKGRFLRREAGQQFFNTSKFTFQNLLADPDNIADNFDDYLQHFSDNVIDIIRRFEFDKEISKLEDNGLLYLIIKEFNSDKAYLGADRISSVDMGYIFEELVRKFSESYDEQAGAHFTARDIIYVMSDILVAGDEERLSEEGVSVAIYDMAMGTSQMLGCLTERLTKLDPEADVTSYGQELNNQTFAIAKADTLIKGGNADNMRQGDTLGNDQFRGYEFDYIISNPPFGIEWKTSKSQVEKETGEGERFAAGLPAIGDGQMLFTLNGISKLKENGRMAIIQNGSPLFKGDAGGGESNIRGFLLENDWTVDRAIAHIRQEMEEDKEMPYYGYVVDEEDKLVGVLSLRNLMLAKPGTVLSSAVAGQSVVSVLFDTDKRDVASELAHYNYMALPVVDYQNHLMGVVTYDDIMDIMHEEASADMLGMVGADPEETSDTPWLESVGKRLPWLCVNMVNSTLSASVVYKFDGTISQMAVLAVLMPMVANQGGNSGQQALAVMIRQLATDRFDVRKAWMAVLREAKIGMLTGLVMAILATIGAWLFTSNLVIGLVMGGALLCDMVLGAVAGGSIPLVFRALGRDPAQASSIFLTTITDGAGFFIFLGLATLFLFS